MLNKKQAYLSMFFLLDYFFSISDSGPHEPFSLGALLGCISPFVFSGEVPADEAKLGDWDNSISRISDEEVISEDQCFEAVLVFLELHRDKYGFDLQYVIDGLPEIEQKKWDECVEKALLHSDCDLVEKMEKRE